MRFFGEPVPYNTMRYPTVGDWNIGPRSGDIHVLTAQLGNDDYEFLVMLHELIEAKLCQKRGITDEAVTAFDRGFEDVRAVGNTDEPGDDPQAPYRREHFFATNIERLMAAELDVDWKQYEDAVNALT
jgi:hypothetical protein